MKYVCTFLICCFATMVSQADDKPKSIVQTKTVEYQDGDLTLEGFMAVDTSIKSNAKPVVLVVHQWMGLTDYEKSRCQQLAELGYVAFAVDIYGKGVRPASVREAGMLAGKYKNDRELYRKRLNLGLKKAVTMEGADKDRVVVIGYCFGGTGAIELARSGADIDGVISFHGGLDSPKPEDGKNIKSKILICHGADDPFVPKAEIEAMVTEFNAAKVDWQMISYSGAVHSFTQKMAGNDNSKGAAYNELADKRSWIAAKDFFTEIFAK